MSKNILEKKEIKKKTIFHSRMSNVCHPTILPKYVSSIVTMPIITQSPPVPMPIQEKPKIQPPKK
jgi:hypothetical protein